MSRPMCTRDTRRNRRGPSGFTLLEMMLVVSVIGLLSAIALPSIDVARFQSNSAVQILSTTMVTAQREAITKQHDLILTFDAAGRTLRLNWDANSNGDIETGERSRVVVLDDRVVFGRGGAAARAFGSAPINFDRTIDGLPALVFHRNGSASGIGGFYITTTRAAGAAGNAADTRAVEIIRATGRTEWFRYNGTTWTRGF